MDGTIIQQGRFTSDGTAKTLEIRSDVDWMEVINFTQSGTTQTTGRGVRFSWQRGFASDSGVMTTKLDSANTIALEVITSGGFTLVDSSLDTPEAAQTGTAITAASPAVATITAHGYSNGDVVRLSTTTGMLQIAGMDFTIGSVAANTFELSYLAAAGFAAPATAVTARRIPFDPIYSPRNRFITGITQATSAVVTLSVTHGYSVGEKIRFNVPSAFGMTEINGLAGEITAVNTTTNTITVDIDSSAFTAFAFPTSASVPFTFAQAVPFAEDASVLTGATDNVGFIGIRLAAGADSPAGSSADVIYWRAGKSLIVNNE